MALAGCGFRPLYGPPRHEAAAPGGPAAAAGEELAAIRVGLIANREGQLLRRALRGRLDPAGSEGVARYELVVGLRITSEYLGVRRDDTPTRARLVAVANWSLLPAAGAQAPAPPGTAAPRGPGAPPQPIAGGRSRAVDAFNLVDQQFFASDLAREEAVRRLADRLAEEITLRLAVFFARRQAAAAAPG